MSTDQPTATCTNPRCQFVIDLTDNRVKITSSPDGGVAACPHCGGTAILSRELIAEARAGRRNLRE